MRKVFEEINGRARQIENEWKTPGTSRRWGPECDRKQLCSRTDGGIPPDGDGDTPDFFSTTNFLFVNTMSRVLTFTVFTVPLTFFFARSVYEITSSAGLSTRSPTNLINARTLNQVYDACFYVRHHHFPSFGAVSREKRLPVKRKFFF